MRREKVKDNMGFQFSVIPWILIYPAMGWLIRWRVEEIFLYLSDESAMARSIEEYMHSVNVTLIIAAAASLVWWVLACNTTNLRKAFEENTLLFGAAFVIALAVAIAVGPASKVFLDNLGNQYKPLAEWCILGGFVFNLLLFSPKNVRRVVFFKGGLGRGAMAVLVTGLSALCVWKGVM